MSATAEVTMPAAFNRAAAALETLQKARLELEAARGVLRSRDLVFGHGKAEDFDKVARGLLLRLDSLIASAAPDIASWRRHLEAAAAAVDPR